MNTLDKVIERSINESVEQEKKRILKEKSLVLKAVKRTYGVENFKTLNESEKKHYAGIVKSLWNENVGLTRAGKKFLTESELELNPNSSSDDIKEYIKQYVKADFKNWFSFYMQDLEQLRGQVKELTQKIESATGKKNLFKAVTTFSMHIILYVAELDKKTKLAKLLGE